MRNQIKYFVAGIIILLFSSPLAFFMMNTIIFSKINLSGEYGILLNGFIHSIMIIGVLIFTVGLVNIFTENNK